MASLALPPLSDKMPLPKKTHNAAAGRVRLPHICLPLDCRQRLTRASYTEQSAPWGRQWCSLCLGCLHWNGLILNGAICVGPLQDWTTYSGKYETTETQLYLKIHICYIKNNFCLSVLSPLADINLFYHWILVSPIWLYYSALEKEYVLILEKP